MENSLKGLMLAAGVIITCIVIGLGFYIANQSKETANNGIGQINKLSSEFTDSDKTFYDGIDISGSEVINVISKFKTESIGIVVTTKSGNTTYYGHTISGSEGNYVLGAETSNTAASAKKPENSNHINSSSMFTGTVLRDANDAIVGIHFVQN